MFYNKKYIILSIVYKIGKYVDILVTTNVVFVIITYTIAQHSLL